MREITFNGFNLQNETYHVTKFLWEETPTVTQIENNIHGNASVVDIQMQKRECVMTVMINSQTLDQAIDVLKKALMNTQGILTVSYNAQSRMVQAFCHTITPNRNPQDTTIVEVRASFTLLGPWYTEQSPVTWSGTINNTIINTTTTGTMPPYTKITIDVQSGTNAQIKIQNSQTQQFISIAECSAGDVIAVDNSTLTCTKNDDVVDYSGVIPECGNDVNDWVITEESGQNVTCSVSIVISDLYL